MPQRRRAAVRELESRVPAAVETVIGTRDTRVDADILRAEPFARPILRTLRSAVHDACPGVTETIKWRMPFFLHEGPLCFMAAFRRHCAFGFWRGSRVMHAAPGRAQALGQLGRMASMEDLPTRRTLLALVRRAVRVNAAGVRSPTRGRPARRPAPRVPAYLRRELAARPRAHATYLALPPSGRRDFIDWLASAKRAETRARRLARTVELLTAGRARDGRPVGRR